jgi:CMP-N-acetylneuraminic acid synthetase
VALFEGTPLVTRAVHVALEAGVFDRVVVSTEDPEIGALAGAAGAEIHERSAELAADSATVIDVCRAVLEESQKQGAEYDAFCVLLPTSPFRRAEHVRAGLALLQERRAHVVMSVAPFPHMPFWAVRERGGFLTLQWSRRYLKSRNQLPTLYRHNGVVLWSRTAPFQRTGSFYGPRVAAYHMSQEDSVDVDEAIDLEFAHFLAQRRTQAV